jgi:hypothetical protein
MKPSFGLVPVCLLALLGTSCTLRADQPVIVHEWGTFTCLQDENGQAIGGINVDDEPVPYFVSSVAIGVAPQYGTAGWYNLGLPPYQKGKGWISGDPRVTMRLETPVLYIYPPKGESPQAVPPIDVHVDFHGGVLSQFYPHADFSGLPKLRFPGQPQDNIFPYVDKATGLTEITTTSLDWKGVQLGSSEKPIDIDDKVWTTPREVSAPVLQVKFSEPDNKGVAQTYTQAEHFLFYRGVGHLNSPLRLGHGSTNGVPGITIGSPITQNGIAGFDAGWLVQIRGDGTCAFYEDSGAKPLPFITAMQMWFPDLPATFADDDYTVENLAKLKASMHTALVKEGLYDDEATAMLKTWDLSYFKSPGLRFFYIVPRPWVDKVLPLKITGPSADITRVMIGRIELVTDAQKAALARLATGPCPDLPALKHAAFEAIATGKLTQQEKLAFYSGEKPLSDLGLPIPPLVQDYLSLGRFRDALIVHEQQLHPSMSLAQFIKANQLVPQEN